MFKGEINTSITAFFLEIHNFMKQIGEDYSPKLAFKVEITSHNLIDMVQFYEKNCLKYREILKSQISKYKLATEADTKSNKVIELSQAEIDKLDPQKKEIEKKNREGEGEEKGDRKGTSLVSRLRPS